LVHHQELEIGAVPERVGVASLRNAWAVDREVRAQVVSLVGSIVSTAFAFSRTPAT
jgi:hypothetical protein